MTYILCIETTTTNCSVSISNDGNVVALKELNSINYSHSEKLHIFIKEVLQTANISLKDLSAVAVSKGPGSYTGLRIGVSAAKGLCFAQDLPLISIDTLQSLAHQVSDDSDFIIPMIDARRMEVYTAVYNNKYKQLEYTSAKILSPDSFSTYLDMGKVVFLGNANEKFKTICTHTNAVFLDDKLPSAKEMAFLANEKHKKSDFENVAYFEPYYLKDFIGN
ncbi:MAG: tRNA (adenosine(37)-N6)-threonylcarbamoyltransferase complex dimerization subunit type 1 TsaB [Flavobacteriaceae bacterium]